VTPRGRAPCLQQSRTEGYTDYPTWEQAQAAA